MSINLYVFPTSPTKICWSELKNKFLELLTPEDIQKLGKISLHRLGSDEIVLENENVSFFYNKDHGYYYLSSDLSDTLGINIRENEPNYVSERDMVEDFARNLDTSTIQTLIQKWKTVGYIYGVESSQSSSQFLTSFAAAIAFLCKGYVVVTSNEFTLNIGVYKPEEFV